MYLKVLRGMSNEVILEFLNDAQKWYNKWFDIWERTRSINESHHMERHLRTINNCKKVLLERNIVVSFKNGWEMNK